MKKTFGKWINSQLEKNEKNKAFVRDLYIDLRDGLILIGRVTRLR